MRIFFPFLYSLQRLSFYKRLLLVILLYIFIESFVVYVNIARGTDRGIVTLHILTGLLAIWLFHPKVALVLDFALMQVYLIIYIMINGWNVLILTTIGVGMFMYLFVVGVVGLLRYALEMTEAAKQRQIELLNLKDQFVTNVHHELRSPLIAILGSLDILRESDDTLSEEERATFVNQAIYGGSELQRITDNILDAVCADTDVSPPWIRTFQLDQVVSDVLRHMNTSSHTLHIDIPEDITAQGDSQQVGQVMRNLLSNGFKYAPEGSPIVVRVWRDDAFAYVCVSDKGPGVPADQIPHLFQKFSRLEHDIAGPVRGIGLGLYVCRRFVENMGGRIWVESAGIPGEGSSFYFMLPDLPSHEMASQS